MSEVRLIDANALRKKSNPMARGEHGLSASTKDWYVSDWDIQQAPTIDAVAVVRCKDCKSGLPMPEKRKHVYAEGVLNCVCRRADPDVYDICAVWPDGYCDEGERKEAPDGR
jgi:hypothetical protein